jgi:histidine triad (HIT) family protein
MNKDCIFCKIIKGDIPSYKIYEDKYTYVFLDIAKDVDGHILVIPKTHFKNILDCDLETLSHVIKTLKKISNHLVNNCGYEGINILNANDESAGQTVAHFHIHIIPRKSNDGIKAWPNFTGATEDLDIIYNNLKM